MSLFSFLNHQQSTENDQKHCIIQVQVENYYPLVNQHSWLEYHPIFLKKTYMKYIFKRVHFPLLLLMAEILHHLGCMKPYK